MTHRRKPRTAPQRWLIRFGVLWCLLILAAAGASLRWATRWVDGQGAHGVQLSCGAVSVFRSANAQRPAWFRWDYWKGNIDAWKPFKSWRDVAFYWRVYGLLPRFDSSASIGSLSVPLWMLLAVVAVPTYRLWRRTSRFPSGCCSSCGYDLTGNRSGVCPECGTPCQPRA